MPSSERRFHRHDLVWLDHARWRDALRSPLDAGALVALDAWFSNRRPAVVRRNDPGVANDRLCLAVALPLTYSERKVALDVAHTAVRYTCPPLPLITVIASAPPPWRPDLTRLATTAHTMGVHLRVYGSLMWQHFSGEPYLTPTSDVDLLWRVADPTTLEKMLAYLLQWERSSGLTADGELLLHDDAAVAWKELLRRPRQLLLKRTSGVELRAYDEALCLIASGSC